MTCTRTGSCRSKEEGGGNILIPIALDDYVFNGWEPDKKDIAERIRARVVTRINTNKIKGKKAQEQLKKLIKALSK